MATVNKNFRIKDGLIVEGTTGTINGSDIITEDKIVGGDQTNISVTYNSSTGMVDFVAENGVADSTTDDLAEGTANLYFTDQRAIDAVGGSATSDNTPNTVVKRDAGGDFAASDVTVTSVIVGTAGTISDEGLLAIDSAAGTSTSVTGDTGVEIASANGNIVLNADGNVYKGSATSTNELTTMGRLDTYIGDGTVNGSTGNTIADRIGAVAGDLSNHISDTSAHGVTGDVVGTTDTQTLTNKTLESPTITVNPGGTVDTQVGGGIAYAMAYDSMQGPTALINVVDPDGDYITAGLSSATTIYLRDLSAGPGSALWYDQLELSAIYTTGYDGHDYQLVIMIPGLDQNVVDALTGLNTPHAISMSSPAPITTVSATELSRLDGVTSNVQAQINAKASSADLSAHISDTSTHGVTGDIVGTTDAQILTNKVINDELYFTNPSTQPNDGGIKINDISEDMEVTAYTANLHLKGQVDVTVTAVNGDIVLAADGATYVNSVSAGNQVATNAYVDNAVSGLAWKQAVNLKVTTNITDLSNAAGTYDGHAVESTDIGYRLLLTGQSTATENGIYVVDALAGNVVLTRSADADTVAELVGAAVFVMEGTTYGGTSWVQNNHYANSFDDLVWNQFSGGGTMVAGTGITVSGLEISVDRTTVDTWYDEAGAAAQALTDANSYADTNFVNVADLPGQLDDYIPLTQKAANNGVATLNAGGQVPTTQLKNVNDALDQNNNGGNVYNGVSYILAEGSYFSQIDSTSTQVGVKDWSTGVISSSSASAGITALYGIVNKLNISAVDNTTGSVHTEEVLIAVDANSNVNITQYAIITTGSSLFDLEVASVSSPWGNANKIVSMSLIRPGSATTGNKISFTIGKESLFYSTK